MYCAHYPSGLYLYGVASLIILHCSHLSWWYLRELGQLKTFPQYVFSFLPKCPFKCWSRYAFLSNALGHGTASSDALNPQINSLPVILCFFSWNVLAHLVVKTLPQFLVLHRYISFRLCFFWWSLYWYPN